MRGPAEAGPYVFGLSVFGRGAGFSRPIHIPMQGRAFLQSCALLASVASAALAPQDRPAPVTRAIPYADARSVIEAFGARLPAELAGKSSADLESAWPGWIERRDTAIRSRLHRGDEDSIVYLWHYGTSFTKLPPVTERNIATLGGASALESIVLSRMEDLITGIVSTRADERLQFTRDVVERKGIDPATAAGKAQLRLYLMALRQRVLAEYEENKRTLDAANVLEPVAALAAYLTMFRERGLSSDTSLLPAFAIEQALESLRAQGTLGPGSLRRLAIVGPGLDVANKDEGYDFYPQQTIQPFALIDSVIRLGLAKPDDLEVTTLDVSPRVNQHIQAARERSRAGSSYTLHLPLNPEERWHPDLVAYWRRLGDKIGQDAPPPPPPASAGRITLRSVRMPPAPVMSIVPRDLNIVVERLAGLAGGDQFDLVVATNILVYYDVFEQGLALVNVGTMLRPGGVFLSNTPVPPVGPMKLSDRYTTVTYSDRQRDFVFAYQRQ